MGELWNTLHWISASPPSKNENPVLPLAVRDFFVIFDEFHPSIFCKTKKWGLNAPIEMDH